MRDREKFNPYEDETIHASQPEQEPANVEDRQGFNDVMKHYDIINGHQMPKRLDQLPAWLRWVVRPIIIINIGGFLLLQIWSLWEVLRSL